MGALTAGILAVVAKALTYMGAVKTATRLRANEIVRAAAAQGYMIKFVWGYDPNPGNTEHHSGLAADFMVFGNRAAGDWLKSYLWSNRYRLRVKHIIWWQTIRSVVVSPGTDRHMDDRGNTTNNHMDHVHVMFLDDRAYVPPGKPAPKPTVKAKPKTSPVRALPILKVGSSGVAVQALQRGLNRAFPAYSRLRVDGDFGHATESVVKEFQKRCGFGPKNVDGAVGPTTRGRLRQFGINV